MTTRIQIRRDTAAGWASANPVLAVGEEALELDITGVPTGRRKLGDGTTAYLSLPWAVATPADVTGEAAARASADTAESTARAAAISSLTANTTTNPTPGTPRTAVVVDAVDQTVAGKKTLTGETRFGSGVPSVSLRAKGGDPTGAGSSTAALNAAKLTLAGIGAGILDLDPGVWAFDNASATPGSGNRLRGAGVGATTVKASGASGAVFYIVGQSDFVIEDFTVDGTLGGQAIVLYECRNFRIRNLRSTNPQAAFITLNQCEDFSLEDIEGQWASNTNSPGAALIYMNRCSDARIVRPRLHGSLLTAITQLGCLRTTIIDPDIDGQWFVLPPRFAGSGAGVTYPSSTTITDTAQPFAGAAPAISAGATVRAMPVRVAAFTPDSYQAARVVAAAATFMTSGVKEGDVVIAGTAWTMVDVAPTSESTLIVDGWRNRSDNLPATTPAGGTATVYRTLVANIASVAGNTITHLGLTDLYGTPVTPAAGTLYEVCYNQGGHGILSDVDCARNTVSGGRIRRCWGDQLNMQGNNTKVNGVAVEWGQDFGIGIEAGSGSSVVACASRHNGSLAVWVTDDCVVEANSDIDSGWHNADTTLGIISVVGSRSMVVGNRLNHVLTTVAKHPVAVRAGGATITATQLGRNLATGFAGTAIALHPQLSNITGTAVANLLDVTVLAGTGTVTGTVQEPATPVIIPPAFVTASNAAWPIPAGAAYLEITAVGGGGSGGAGGSAATSATNQAPGGGGGSGGTVTQVVAVGANTTLAITIGFGGAGGAGGAAGGNPGSWGSGFGGATTVTGTGIAVGAVGGMSGAPSGASTTAPGGGGFPAGADIGGGVGAITTTPGQGGPGQYHSAGALGSAASGGGGGGAATSTNGGGGGAAGSFSGAAAAGGTGTSATTSGTAGANAAANSGGGGGGGGGGAGPTGAGGNGGNGGTGVVIIRVVG